jgi:chromosome segregation protein
LNDFVRKTPRLKALELQGFKTFVNKNTFEFAPTITSFVGPNGSGKSNIADSIRWVLGEQSYALLRAKKTEDMIFSGSDTRSRSSMASASIVFDNEDGWLPIDFTEVTIARRAYRDGINEYLINGQKVRLRDVTELLAQCGLSQRTYTIIGQGLVDAALSLNPEERRRLFEEAAGIGLYRNRKREALRRLDTTRRNLERVQDIITELRPRLRSLERQAKRAKDHNQVKEDLKSVMRIWYGYHWYQLQDQVTNARNHAEARESDRNNLRQEQIEAEQELIETRSRINSLRTKLHQWSQDLSELYRTREEVGKSLAVSSERHRWLADQERSLHNEIGALEEAQVTLSNRIQVVRQEKEQRQAEIEEIQKSLQAMAEAETGEETERTTYWSSVEKLREEVEGTAAQHASKSIQLEQLQEQILKITAAFDTASLNVRSTEGDKVVVEEELREAISKRDRIQQGRHGIESELRGVKDHLERLRENKTALVSQRSQVIAKESAARAQLELIKQLGEAPTDVVEVILDGLRQGRLKGLAGRFWDKLTIESGYESAISAALGDFKGALTFHSSEDVNRAVKELLEKEVQNRTSLLPLTVDQSSSPLEPLSSENVLGNALNFIQAPEGYQPILNLLLGRTLVVKDRETALSLLPDLDGDARLVTLGGDLFYPSSLTVLGAHSESRFQLPPLRKVQEDLNKVKAALDNIAEAIRKLEADEKEKRDRQAWLEDNLVRIREELNGAQLLVEKKQFEKTLNEQNLKRLQDEILELEGEKKELEAKLASLRDETEDMDRMRLDLEQVLQKAIGEAQMSQPGMAEIQARTRLEVANQGLMDLEDRLQELTGQLNAFVGDIEQRQLRLSSTNADISSTGEDETQAEGTLSNLEGQIHDLEAQIQPEEEALGEAEKARLDLESNETRIRSELRIAERSHSQAQIDLARLDEELVSLKRRIEDDFGLVTYDYYETDLPEQEPLPLEGYVEHLPRVEVLPEDSERQVNRLRSQLRRLGVVNPEATSEYETVRSRVEFLTSQMEDTKQAEEQIQDVIAELDLLMEREFRKTFDAVALEFREAFTRLFGGGSARLTLTDPSDLTGTGIDIEARLPGRREQGLAVLSGGERSLTAAALIFALMKVSPTPFCVLDEVDAMLDDANVIRFREMLVELSGKTQFVVITHNRQTVQASEVIFGVTMGSDSASQVISLRLDEAEKAIVGD